MYVYIELVYTERSLESSSETGSTAGKDPVCWSQRIFFRLVNLVVSQFEFEVVGSSITSLKQ